MVVNAARRPLRCELRCGKVTLGCSRFSQPSHASTESAASLSGFLSKRAWGKVLISMVRSLGSQVAGPAGTSAVRILWPCFHLPVLGGNEQQEPTLKTACLVLAWGSRSIRPLLWACSSKGIQLRDVYVQDTPANIHMQTPP